MLIIHKKPSETNFDRRSVTVSQKEFDQIHDPRIYTEIHVHHYDTNEVSFVVPADPRDLVFVDHVDFYSLNFSNIFPVEEKSTEDGNLLRKPLDLPAFKASDKDSGFSYNSGLLPFPSIKGDVYSFTYEDGSQQIMRQNRKSTLYSGIPEMCFPKELIPKATGNENKISHKIVKIVRLEGDNESTK